jgi:hypothetical protein
VRIYSRERLPNEISVCDSFAYIDAGIGWLQRTRTGRTGNLPPPPPPKKTADQVYNEVMSKIEPHIQPANPRTMPFVAQLQEAVNTLKPPMEPNAPEGLNQVKRNLYERIEAAEQNEQWNYVVALAAGLDVFAKGPPPRTGELQKNERYRSRAQAELSKPRVKVEGFLDDYVFLDVFLPATNQQIDVQVREGDSFIPDPQNPGENLLRLDDIIGDNRAIQIYYYKTDTSWEVKGPRG